MHSNSITPLLPILLHPLLTLALTPSPFTLSSLTTHQPNGNPAGQVNYYNIAFSINSTNSGAPTTAWCQTFWGDNAWTQPEAHSVNVPTGKWIACDSAPAAYDGNSTFQFQLFPYFSIGNFSLAVREDVSSSSSSSGGSILILGSQHVDNTTAQYTCAINPREVKYQQHAHGDCSMPTGAQPFEMAISEG
jgi:hypothetical protein